MKMMNLDIRDAKVLK